MATSPATGDPSENEFARAVRSGLSRPGQKELPSSYFYDDIGSALFDVITLLPEYGLTRADERLVREHAGEVVACMRSPSLVAELGSGSGSKTRWLLETLAAREPAVYYPIDISRSALDRCAQELRSIARVIPLAHTYLDGLREAACRRARGQSLLVLFLGSTIGNLERAAAADFLRQVRCTLLPGDALLLGTDLEKEIPRMRLAYDDPAGVTASFNLNLLGRINRELDGDFILRNFAHEARYNTRERRIEMHLRSLALQRASIAGAGFTCELAAGETIRTELCHKFQKDEVARMAERAGFACRAQWIDAAWPFAESLLVADA